MKRTRPSKTERISWATATATVVLPIPPGPTIVTNFSAANLAWILATASFRPTMRVKRAGSRELESKSISDVSSEGDVIGTMKL